jgi:hypothetical protein
MNRPTRYPVFLRGENDHCGSISELIHDAISLDSYLKKTLAESESNRASESILIVEFCAEPDDNGNFVKYGAYRVGDFIIPAHRLESAHWCVKYSLINEAVAKANLEYAQSNPHAHILMDIFEIAGIDYGRVDYGFFNGHIQVYEINTNPSLPRGFHPLLRESGLLFQDRFIQALKSIEVNIAGEYGVSHRHRSLIAKARRQIDREDIRKQHYINLQRYYKNLKCKLIELIKYRLYCLIGNSNWSRLREIRNGIRHAIKPQTKSI